MGSRQGTTGGAFAVVVNLYVDWNQDYEFDDQDELMFASEPTGLEVSGSFQIPLNAGPGEYRMRVVLTNTVNLP